MSLKFYFIYQIIIIMCTAQSLLLTFHLVIFQVWCWFQSRRFRRRPNFKWFERRFLQLERRKLRSVRRRLGQRGRVHGPTDLLLQNVHAVRIRHAQKWGAAVRGQAVRSGSLLVVVKCFWLINRLWMLWSSHVFLCLLDVG